MAAVLVNILEGAEYLARVDEAVDVLNAGGLVVVPTETVYGAAGLLNQPQALARLKDLRGGNAAMPFTIHVARRDAAARYLGPVSELGQRMMKKLWPGPVGIMFQVPAERRRQVADELGVAEAEIYDGEWITLRCPDHPIATDIIERASGPVILTAGGVSQPAQKAEPIADELGDRVDLVLNAGPTRYSKPSTLVKAFDDRYEIVRAGVYDERIIERLMHTTILFVCSGNTCRSPMAEAIARDVLARKLNVPESELESKGISVLSAGSFAMPGTRAAAQAIDVVGKLGLDLSRHRSRPLTVELIHQADLIFTMSRSHQQAVTGLVPSAAEKTATLDPARDIEDPIGGDLTLYTQVAEQLKTLIEQRLGEQVLK